MRPFCYPKFAMTLLNLHAVFACCEDLTYMLKLQ